LLQNWKAGGSLCLVGRGNTLPENKWYEYINEPTLANAICDRLTANSNKIELKGDSTSQKKNKLHQL